VYVIDEAQSGERLARGSLEREHDRENDRASLIVQGVGSNPTFDLVGNKT